MDSPGLPFSGLDRQGREAPALRDDFPELPAPSAPSSSHGNLVELLDRGVLELLNQSRSIGRESPDWRLGERSEGRLWTITLHYHDWAYLLADHSVDREQNERSRLRAAGLFRHYVGDWIERCSLEYAGTRALAWNSYAIATRFEWWIRSYLLAYETVFAPAPAFEERFLQSLWRQASHLSSHLEWDLRGNHLLRDLVGLALAGRFLRDRRAEGWLCRASALTLTQIEEQVLPDGGHFERSPAYHMEVMHDLSLLHALLEDEDARSAARSAWSAMAATLAWMRHPDGDLVQLNDCSLPGAKEVEHALEASRQVLGRSAQSGLEPGAKHLPDTGLVIWRRRPWALFFDVGPVGNSVQPGHAHADNLTIECSFEGRRLIVDPGTYGYDLDERRRYDRATGSHNTVSIDGESSTEVWHVFRVGRRARPVDVEVELAFDRLLAAASHDGYDHLPGRPRHRRILRVEEGELQVTDRIAGSYEHVIEGGFLVHPDWDVEPISNGWLLHASRGHRVELTCEASGSVQRLTEVKPYHPSNGIELRTTRIGWRWQGVPPLEVRVILKGV